MLKGGRCSRNMIGMLPAMPTMWGGAIDGGIGGGAAWGEKKPNFCGGTPMNWGCGTESNFLSFNVLINEINLVLHPLDLWVAFAAPSLDSGCSEDLGTAVDMPFLLFTVFMRKS